MANVDTTLTFTIEENVTASFDVSMLPAGYATLGENQENIINISDAITSLGTPTTMTISAAEVTDTDNAISAVGLSTSGTAGEGTASVSVTPNSRNGVDALHLHVTTANISCGDTTATVRVRLEQPN